MYVASVWASLLGVLFSAFLGNYYFEGHTHGISNMGWLTIAQYSLLSLCMFFAWWSAPPARALSDVRLLLIVAVVARLVLIPAEPYLSNDMDRYLFDGKIALEGYDPYRVSHDAPELAALTLQWEPPQEHVQYATLYPPLSLALFTVTAAAGLENAPLLWKSITTLFGILTVFVVTLLLRQMGKLRHLPLVALSPLLLLETGVGAHVDSVSTFFVALALYAYSLRRLWLTGVFIGLGTLTKILPIMLMIPLVFGQRIFSDRVKLVLALVITVAFGYGSAIVLGFVPIGTIGTLFEKWRFGSPLFSMLESFLEGRQLAVVTAAGLLTGFCALAYKSWRLDTDIPANHAYLAVGMVLVLLLSPVVFPWYLMALVPLIAIAPRPFLITWSCMIPVTYEVLNGFHSTGEWSPAMWPLVVILLGFFGSLIMEFRVYTARQYLRQDLRQDLRLDREHT